MTTSSTSPRLARWVLLSCVVGTCAAQMQVTTQHDPQVDFSALKTFTWLESDIGYSGSGDPVTAFKVQKQIHDGVIAQLEQKGYTEITEGQPDFYVSYHVVVSVEEREGTEKPYVIFDNTKGSVDSFEVQARDVGGEASIENGTLLLFFVDPKTKRLIWQGTAEGTADSPRQALKRSRKAVKEMLAAFPPS